MLHAFLITTHQFPELTDLIINKLRGGKHHFFIHIDKKVDARPFLYLQDKYGKNVHFIRHRTNVHWGGYSQIRCTLRMIREIQKTHIPFDYYHTISGQDFPLCNAEEFDKRFTENKQYLPYHDCTTSQMWIDRYMKIHLTDFVNPREKNSPLKVRIKNFMWWFEHKFEKHFFPMRRQLPMHAYGGPNWWSLTSDFINWMMHYLNRHPSYKWRFHNTLCCDEIFFPTLLVNSPFRDDIVLDNMHYLHWSKGHSGPDRLTLQHLDEIKKSNALFIRKVHPIESKELLETLNS